MIIKKVLIFLTLLASSISQVWAKDCDGSMQLFSHVFAVTYVTDNELTLEKNDDHVTMTIALGEYFDGVVHKHGNTRYQLISITAQEAKIRAMETIDASSFGGEIRQYECLLRISI